MCYFPCVVDSIIETPKELSITYLPFVGVPADATSSNFGKLQFSIPHTALLSPPPHREFLNSLFSSNFPIIPSWVHFSDLYLGHQIEMCHKMSLYFFV